jgi:hypothetical protein
MSTLGASYLYLPTVFSSQSGVSLDDLEQLADARSYPQVILKRLSSHTLISALPPTSLMISCTALYYHSHMQFTFPGFIQVVKVAAGKSGTAASRAAARMTLSQWINSDAVGARRVFANAAMLSCLLLRHTFEYVSKVSRDIGVR